MYRFPDVPQDAVDAFARGDNDNDRLVDRPVLQRRHGGTDEWRWGGWLLSLHKG